MKKEMEILTIIVLGFMVSFYLPDEIPGVHFDEARHANTAKNIINGTENPLIEQGNYAGNYAYYFLVLEFLISNKYDVFSLRFLIVVANIIAAIFLYFAIKEYSKRAAYFSALILSALPFHIIFSRIAWPEFTLIPLFFSISLFFFVRYLKRKELKYLCLFFFFFFVGVGNKLIFLVYLPSFFLYLLIHDKSIINVRNFIILILFSIIGTFPLLLHNLYNKMPVIKDIKHRSVSEIIEAFPNFYKSLTGVLDGSIAFLRIGGKENSFFAIVNPIIFLFSILFLLKSRHKLFTFLFFSYLLFAPFFYAFTANYLYAPRYFITFLPLAAIVIGFFFDELYRGLGKNITILTFLLVLIINFSSIVYNFTLLYNIHVDYGSFRVGSHIEAKDHFIPTFKDIAKFISNYSEIYFYEHFTGDPRSVLEFLTNKPVNKFQLEDFKGKIGENSIYFAIDPPINNESLQMIEKFGLSYKTVEFKNRLNQTVIKMYVLGD